MLHRWFRLIIFAIALTGAPFGMGRMMDGGHGNAQQTMAGHMHGTAHTQDHAPSTPHYMACAACSADMPHGVVPNQLLVMAGLVQTGVEAGFSGETYLPPVPPPQA